MKSQVALWKIDGGVAFFPIPLQMVGVELVRGVAFVAMEVSVPVGLFPSLDGSWEWTGNAFWLVFVAVGGE